MGRLDGDIEKWMEVTSQKVAEEVCRRIDGPLEAMIGKLLDGRLSGYTEALVNGESDKELETELETELEKALREAGLEDMICVELERVLDEMTRRSGGDGGEF